MHTFSKLNVVLATWQQCFQRRFGALMPSSTPYLKKLRNCFCYNFVKFLLTLIIFGKKYGKEVSIIRVALIFYLTKFASTHYRAKHRCSTLLHNAELLSAVNFLTTQSHNTLKFGTLRYLR